MVLADSLDNEQTCRATEKCTQHKTFGGNKVLPQPCRLFPGHRTQHGLHWKRDHCVCGKGANHQPAAAAKENQPSAAVLPDNLDAAAEREKSLEATVEDIEDGRDCSLEELLGRGAPLRRSGEITRSGLETLSSRVSRR